MSLQSLSMFSFLLTQAFWSKVGFFISYVATSFIVLEVFRLVYSDSTKREAERLLESYTKARTASPLRSRSNTVEVLKNYSIDDLERSLSNSSASSSPKPKRERTSSSLDSERSTSEEKKRRSRTRSDAAHVSAPTAQHGVHQHTSTSPRRLRKRSDTLTSTGSAEHRSESRSLFRRRRSASPAVSEAGSKASSRQGSPLRRSRKEKELLGLGMSVGAKAVKTKV